MPQVVQVKYFRYTSKQRRNGEICKPLYSKEVDQMEKCMQGRILGCARSSMESGISKVWASKKKLGLLELGLLVFGVK